MPLSLQARYEDIRLLGEGGVGVVYRAHDPRLGREVAVKLLKHGDPARHRRLLREARAQARVHHENVCPVYDAGEVDGEPYIVMQFVEGEPLWRLSPRLTLTQKVEIMRAVSAAMHAAHRLGLVHRDLKPGNILVEPQAGGGLKPYIVDFGLAREVGGGAGKETLGSDVAGTPAYMAPEQAAGGRIDVRTDVYSLGATLYELLSGRPPYVDDAPWKILARIASEEPAPLRSVGAEVPAALEAVTMTCLSREPARRYGSARALAEDLQRFLEGQRVGARRPLTIARMWRRLRRRKELWAVSTLVLLAAVAVVAVLWVRSEADAAARLAQELGREAAGMELLMRSAYQMPLHDVNRERALVRERLSGLERRLSDAGRAAQGPLHYAIGRGRLSVGDLEEAEAHLEAARAAGYAPAELDYALGTTLLKLHGRRYLEVHRIADEAERTARLAEIDARYQAPALALLGQASAGKLEPLAYGEALRAYYAGEFEEARVRAAEAFEQSPMLFEAKRLEGEALAGLSLRDWTSGRPDAWGVMSARLEAAQAAFQTAEDVARSDPELLRAACLLGTRTMFAARFHGEAPRPRFGRARVACEKAVIADPLNPLTLRARADLHALYAYALAGDPQPGEAPEREVRDAVRFAEEALPANPNELEAYKTLGTALRAQMLLELNRGIAPRASVRRATEVYEAGIAKFPPYGSAQESLATVLAMMVRVERWRGVSVEPTVERALALLDEGTARGASLSMSDAKRATLFLEQGYWLLDKGRSPEEVMRRALEALRAGEARSPGWHGFARYAAEAHLIRAMDAQARGESPQGALAEAVTALRLLEVSAPGMAVARDVEGMVALVEARQRVRDGRDPGEPLRRARGAFAAGAAEVPWVLSFAVGLAQVELVAGAWAVSQGKTTDDGLAVIQAVKEKLSPWLVPDLADPEPYVLLAEACALSLAQLPRRSSEGAEALLKEGFAFAEMALMRNPRLASALAVQGRLFLLQVGVAQAAANPIAAAEAKRQAYPALMSAVLQNPLLERELLSALAEASRE
ncbi:serine/threonine-protein kinase [Chondromyces crocatus]|uniref:serine/threonine-protein kinase n=1 Tax=Chondromyces crocatus TaxID=52 RepID=UPI001C54CBE5|nr:serine/threonine-protein kinase [Chondromyces crocatus]